MLSFSPQLPSSMLKLPNRETRVRAHGLPQWLSYLETFGILKDARLVCELGG